MLVSLANLGSGFWLNGDVLHALAVGVHRAAIREVGVTIGIAIDEALGEPQGARLLCCLSLPRGNVDRARQIIDNATTEDC
ncbi:hypothetical protein [Cupriavidus sp. UME77]|uniref:hypothetical protein n=1 Tax=Cupriavidus sp. UME77 TaxID=1862321 RepID=UPI001600ADD7|nr:hypothetical protein [Cupriavidus sp. UME77]MBB1631038.1 hypothetical protein [Cupriavidus sp. UME77]